MHWDGAATRSGSAGGALTTAVSMAAARIRHDLRASFIWRESRIGDRVGIGPAVVERRQGAARGALGGKVELGHDHGVTGGPRLSDDRAPGVDDHAVAKARHAVAAGIAVLVGGH